MHMTASACTAFAASCSQVRPTQLGIPLVEVRIPPACVNDVYEARMAQAFASPPLSDVEAVAFGDLFLEDVRAYREAATRRKRQAWSLPAVGTRHGRPGTGVHRAPAFRRSSSVWTRERSTPPSPGGAYDEQLLADLPASVDPCGENGEFHTFVPVGLGFARPLEIVQTVGMTVERDGFAFCDLKPA